MGLLAFTANASQITAGLGVTQIIPGTNITISPESGIGEVTVNGGGGIPLPQGASNYLQYYATGTHYDISNSSITTSSGVFTHLTVPQGRVANEPAVSASTFSLFTALNATAATATQQFNFAFSSITSILRGEATAYLSINGSTQTKLGGLNVIGNVGIGTTNADQKLRVEGRIWSTSGGFVFPDGSTQTTSASAAVGFVTLTASQTFSGANSFLGKSIYGLTTPYADNNMRIYDNYANSTMTLRITGYKPLIVENYNSSVAIVAINSANGGSGSPDEVVGWRFTVSSMPIYITALGHYTNAGLGVFTSGTRDVGLYNASGVLLASASVSATGFLQNSFYYQYINPVRLEPYTDYTVLAAELGNTWASGVTKTLDPAISTSNPKSTASTPLVYTDENGSGLANHYGPGLLFAQPSESLRVDENGTTIGGQNISISLNSSIVRLNNMDISTKTIFTTYFSTSYLPAYSTGTTYNITASTGYLAKLGIGTNSGSSILDVSGGSVTIRNPYGLQVGTMLVVQAGRGMVGIGTINPGGRLQVANSAGATGPQLVISTGDMTATTKGNLFEVNGTSIVMRVPLYFDDGSVQIAAPGSSQWAVNGSHIYNANAGNVGIGTTNPSARLDIFGGSATIRGGYGLQVGTMMVVQQGSGNVGIGTTNVSSKFEVFNGSITIQGTNAGLRIGNTLVTTTNGNVGIGTTLPNAKLHIGAGGDAPAQTVADLIVTRAGASAIVVRDSTNNSEAQVYAGPGEVVMGSYTNDYVDLKTNNATVMRLTTGGNVGIGATNPTAQLHTTGSVRFQTFGLGTLNSDASGNITSVSDERYKNIESTFTASLAEISNINPINYRWKSEVSIGSSTFQTGWDTTTLMAGFSGQNIKQNIPEATGVNKDSSLSLYDRPIIAALVNAVKELHSQVIDLRNKVEILEQP